MATNITPFVQNLYSSVLLRTGDSGGIDYWVARANDGMSAADMTRSFISSAEAQNPTAVLRLYDVFFNRTADSDGLAFWVNALNNGATLRDIAESFGGSDEFLTKFVTASTATCVEEMYGNMFSRPSDAAGKAYWINQIDSGAMTRADVGLMFSQSAEALSSTTPATRNAESYLVLRASGMNNPTTSAVEALATKSLSTACAEEITNYNASYSVTGRLMNSGYLGSATVFADANEDGIWTAGESTTIADAQGNFRFYSAKGTLIFSGGTDLSTSLAFGGTFKAPANSTVINSLTALESGLIATGLTVSAAEQVVGRALGVDVSTIHFGSFDPIAQALSPTATAAQKTLAVQVQGESVKVANLIVNASNLLVGAAGGTTKLSMADAYNAVILSLVDTIQKDADGVISLTDKVMLQNVLTNAVNLSSSANLQGAAANMISAMKIDFSTMLADSAENINGFVTANGDPAATLVKISQVGTFTQGAMANAITTAAGNGSLAPIVSIYSGAAADASVTATKTWQVSPDTTADDAATTASNAVAVTAAAIAAAAAAAAAAQAEAAAATLVPITYILTTAADNFTGNNGNDTFVSTYDAAVTDTFNNTDILNGGAGTDTLTISHLIDVAITPPDNLWTGVTNIEKIVINTTGNGAQTITTAAAFQAAFNSAGVNLTTDTSGSGAINITMDTFTGSSAITATSLAGAQTIITGSGVSTVNASSAAGALTIYGVGLTSATALTTGAGAQTIGNAIGGGANLVTVTATSNSGAQTITSTSTSNASVVATSTSGPQTIVTGTGNDTITSTSGVGTSNTISTNAGNDTIVAGLGNDLITGGLGADSMTGGGGTDTFAFGANGSIIGTSMDVITDFNTSGPDVMTFNGATTVLPLDGSIAIAGTNVQQSAGGKITFAAGDNTLTLKIAAVQADVELDVAGSIAMFVDGANTYVYYAGTAAGNADDQLIQLSGITSLVTITGGATTTIA